MRHRKKGKKLGRDSSQRRALFKNLVRSFFLNRGKIKTTLAKAKAVQPKVEKTITRAKKGDLASRRKLFSYFQDQDFVNLIVDEFVKDLDDRSGGYTRIIKIKKRRGDDATVACLELVAKKEAGNNS